MRKRRGALRMKKGKRRKKLGVCERERGSTKKGVLLFDKFRREVMSSMQF